MMLIHNYNSAALVLSGLRGGGGVDRSRLGETEVMSDVLFILSRKKCISLHWSNPAKKLVFKRQGGYDRN